MVSQKDFYISANILVKQHGVSFALTYADERIEELDRSGDKRGALVWNEIKKAILVLSNEEANIKH